jgi:hypothetical protein
MAKPMEMAKLALYLCSEDSAFATGASFVLDGGIGGIDHPKVEAVFGCFRLLVSPHFLFRRFMGFPTRTSLLLTPRFQRASCNL